MCGRERPQSSSLACDTDSVDSVVKIVVAALACLGCTPQPSATLARPGAEPVADAPAVIVEAQTYDGAGARGQPAQVSASDAIVLDPAQVDPSLSSMIPERRVQTLYGVEQPWIGAAQPTVTAVVFVDYDCPYCIHADHRLRELVAAYPEDLRVVVRMYPLAMHPDAEEASRAALAAHRQGGFEAFHYLLFDEPGRDEATFASHARALGLDPRRLRDDRRAAFVDDQLDADHGLGEELGLVGVPTIYVNGLEIDDIDQMAAVIEAERALGERLMAAGAPRAEVWARIMAASEALP